MKKRFAVSWIVTALICVFVLSFNVFADDAAGQEEVPEIEPVEVSETVQLPGTGEDDNDELFAGYVDMLFGIASEDEMSLFSVPAGDSLSGVNASIYSDIAAKAREVAAGNLASTVFEFTFEELGYTEHYTAEDLGVSAVVVDGNISDEAMAALEEKRSNDLDLSQINKALLADLPYDLYWYDKTGTGGASYNTSYSIGAAYENGEYVCYFSEGTYTFSFAVAESYQASDKFTVDTSLAQTAAKSADIAGQIVDEYDSLSDPDKLKAFKDRICTLVSYNHDAADESTGTAYGDPWQLIWVFDGDDSTNVVCEGYSKAFKYLCDKSVFNGDIKCITVSGLMGGGTGAGNHMWNIVAMDDGRNYLVDVTNCDSGTVGADDLLFMVPFTSGNASDGYSFACNDSTITYTYDSSMEALYGAEFLEISAEKYSSSEPIPEPVSSGTCGDNLTWTLDEEGVLTISGEGAMDDYTSDTPWSDYAEDITEVVVEEGVTNIGCSAFAGSGNLAKVAISDSVTAIGEYAFVSCSSLSDIRLSESLTDIGQNAFASCESLITVTVPDSVIWIREGAFAGCTGLTDIYLSNSLEELESNVFYECSSLTSLTIPASVTSIGRDIVDGCDNLFELSIEEGNAVYDSRNNCNAIIETETNTLIFGYSRTVIPDTVACIGQEAFAECYDLTEITIPDGVTTISEIAFANCTALTSLAISESVTKIGDMAFNNCFSLTSITVDGNNTVYDSRDNCNAIIETSSNTLILGCGTSFIPAGVKKIGGNAFDSMPITRIFISAAIKSIGISAFTGCADLTDVYYESDESQWSSISIGKGNGYLTAATIHYQHEHDLEETVIETATCSHEGQSVFTCSECGHSFTETITVEHTAGDAVTENEIAATCQEEGSYDEVIYCTVCGTEISRTAKTTDKLAHTEVIIPAVAATCTEAGLSEGKKCSVCEVVITAQKTVPALGHKFGVWEETKAATCTEEGEESRKCSRCDEVETRVTEIIDHELEYHAAKAATCTEAGWNAYESCINCDYTTYKEVPATGHNFEEVVYEWSSDNSTVTASRTCKNDASHVETETVETEATTTDATCTEVGTIVYSAEFENEVFEVQTKTVTGKSLGHKEGEAVKENEVAATCTKDGSYDEVVYCQRCGEELSRTSKIIEKIAHTEEVIPGIAATCTETGLTEGKKCSVCGEMIIEQETIPATGHTPGEAVKENEIPATVTEEGSYDEVIYCTVCGTEISRIAKTTARRPRTPYDVVKYNGTWTYLGADGNPDYTFNGVASNTNGTWLIVNGTVAFSVSGVVNGKDGNWYYVSGGKVQTGYTGIRNNSYGWWRIVNGKVDFSAKGVYQNEYGWWYVKGGKVQFDYTGIQSNSSGWWRIVKGKVDFSATGVYQNEYGWWYCKGGKVQFGYTGIQKNEYGWWRIVKGKVDFNATGLFSNEYGTWYCKNGKVQFNFTGTINGKKVVNGKVVS